MLELAWKGTKPVALGDTGLTRTFIQDGDTVNMRAWAEAPGGIRVGFGDCAGTVLPATPYKPRA